MGLKDMETYVRCEKCEFAQRIAAVPINWSFIGCYHDPYQGKRVVEIKKCPKDELQEAILEAIKEVTPWNG